jgi:hypothetical protein
MAAREKSPAVADGTLREWLLSSRPHSRYDAATQAAGGRGSGQDARTRRGRSGGELPDRPAYAVGVSGARREPSAQK